MRLLRYVQPPTQAGSGDTVFPALFTPFKVTGASSSATLTGGGATAISYSIIHQAADLATILGAWGGTGNNLAQTEIVTFSSTGVFGATAAADIGSGLAVSFSLPVPIPQDLWIMPGERLIFRAVDVDPNDSITSLVWSIVVP